MIKWTTPTLTCILPDDVDYDYVILTLKQGSVVVEKTIQASEIQDGQFTATFAQSETGQFDASNMYEYVEAQLNIVKGDTRLATNIVKLEIDKNLHNEAISI